MFGRYLHFRFLALALLALGLCQCGNDGGGGTGPANLAVWPMHPIDSRFRGANALGSGDVDGDGRADYVTNYEFDQRYVIEFHPGASADVRRPWPAVVAFFYPPPLGQDPPIGVDTEHAALGDFDGDGNLDIVGAQGSHPTGFWEGQSPGVRLIWGPPRSEVENPDAWVDAGRIPATIDRGHFLYVVPKDINGDGRLDIVAGGRVQWDNGAKAAIRWIEGPSDPAARRDLSQWRAHAIDPDQLDGHGFIFDDVDEDGDEDIVDANADFDTPEDEETVHWYENPGAGSDAQREPWTKHVVYRGSEFYFKPQVDAADLDGDGHVDLVTQTADDFYWFRKTAVQPVTWERVVIRKDPVAQWLARPTRVVDINGDGRLDLFGMLTHDGGVVPSDRAAAFWMEYRGDQPAADNWTTHVIKWGSGAPMLLSTFGEKWDQVQFADIDADGDLDIVANCEEWWADQVELIPWWDSRVQPTGVSVVWFENRLAEPPYACREREGLCAIEAEHFTDLDDGTWIKQSRFSGYGGDGYLQDHDTVERTPRERETTAGARYSLTLAGGTYSVWVRRWAPAAWGQANLGGPLSNSAWLDIDGAPLGGIFDDGGSFDAWVWVRSPLIRLGPGEHVLRLRTREGGYAVDRIVFSSDSWFAPNGTGPAETVGSGGP